MAFYPIHDSKYFDVREFVHPRTWSELGESVTRCSWMVSPKIVRCADLVRELSGVPCIINNWHFYEPKSGEKKYVSSGYRAKWDGTGAAYSQHRLGLACDIKPKGYTPEKTYNLIMNNKGIFIEAGLTTIEDISMTPTWLHIDCRTHFKGMADIMIVQP